MAAVVRENNPTNEIRLTKPQTRFFIAKEKYPLFCGGFGSGKSETLFLKLINEKIKHPKVDLGYFAPSYQLIRDIAYGRIQNLLDSMRIKHNLNKAENVLFINGYGKILFRTLEVPERIIGYELFASFLDELDTMRDATVREAWQKVMARTRQIDPDDPKALNKIYSATTPEGFGFCYRRWEKDAIPGYRLIRAPTYSNIHLPDDYVDSLRASYPANLIEAYIEGLFVNLAAKTVYSNFSRKTNHTSEIINPGDEIFIGMDFNVNNMAATVHKKINKIPYACAELTGIADTPAMIEVIQFKYPEDEHKITIYPDSSGRTASSMDASSSDITLLRKAGFSLKYKSKNPFRRDRVMAMQAGFRNGRDEVNYFVNTDICPEYTDALEQQSYDRNGVPEKDTETNVDDLNDSAGYFMHYDYPVTRREFKQAHVANY